MKFLMENNLQGEFGNNQKPQSSNVLEEANQNPSLPSDTRIL